MRKQAEQLVVGRVYADTKYNSKPTLLKFFGYTFNGSQLFTRVKGTGYNENDDGTIQFSKKLVWHELTPEEDAIYNKPSETTYLADDEHECKHCGVMTTQPDEECYKATTDTSDAKDLEYWKKNAEDDYMTTPISVLRYITELEKAVIKQLPEPPSQ